MALEPLKIIKRWATRNAVDVKDWDAITNPLLAWALRVQNNLKQIGLDINGSSYEFNNVGKQTQTLPILTRLDTLEFSQAFVGFRNLSIDLTDQAIVNLVSGDGSNLSSNNVGIVVTNSTSNAGRVKVTNVEANIALTLTGAHWGFDGDGDLSDQILWIYLIDTGSAVVLGVSAQGARNYVTSSDCKTVASSVTSLSHILVSSAVSADSNCITLGWVKADFDDTGNAGGENYWQIQNAAGDINLGNFPSHTESVVLF